VLPVAVELNSLVWFGTVWLSCGIDLVWLVGKGLIYNGLRLIGFDVSVLCWSTMVGLYCFGCSLVPI